MKHPGSIRRDAAIRTACRSGLLPIDAYTLPSRESRIASGLSRKAWSRLNVYDCTLPTGVRIGKRWRRTDTDGNWIGTYQLDGWGGVEVVFRRVVIFEDDFTACLRDAMKSRFPRARHIETILSRSLEAGPHGFARETLWRALEIAVDRIQQNRV